MEILLKEGLKENVRQTAGYIKKKLEKYATREELKQSVSSVYRPKGSVQTFAELPEEKEIGDVYDVKEANGNNPAGTNYVWTGEEWDALGGMVDLSPFARKDEVNAELLKKVNATDLVAISAEDIEEIWNSID